jgi:uncharacterized protein YjbJ (UPF0337 family)
MSNKASEIMGNIKETVGNWTGNEKVESEGNAQKNSSKVQGHVDNAKQNVDDYVGSAKDRTQGTWEGLKSTNNNTSNNNNSGLDVNVCQPQQPY